jgi:3-phenylpropionate/trans-cinnamate dioxygenase ferredoxin subunit
VVGRANEVPPGECLIITVAGRSVGIFNVEGRLFAIRNRCPHQGAELCRGAVVGAVESSSPGDFAVNTQKPLVRCPWHGWEFDLETGQSWFDPQRTRIRSYAVGVVSGKEVPYTGAGSERQPGPYLADTYPAFEEDRVIVVDMGS